MAADIEIRVPDIGDFDDVEIVEVLVSVGDRVQVEDSLVTLESDKASMEIPSPQAGVVTELKVNLGDRVSEGALLVVLSPDAELTAEPEHGVAAAPAETPPEPPPALELRQPGEREPPPSPVAAITPEPQVTSRPPHASPLVRRYARDIGVDLTRTQGSGPAGRILVDDVKTHVREVLAQGGGSRGALPEVPEVDFARFGAVERLPLNKVRRVAAASLTRSWLNVPHVTQHEEADITALEAFRKRKAPDAEARGVRLSPLFFVMKAVVAALRRFQEFRSSLDPSGESLIVKQYFHLGVAVDTDSGLIVPVVRDVDQKGIFELAEEVADLAEKARARKLRPLDMQGACFTISSLGGIGGSYFTPIVNAPEVAILGLSRTVVKPVWSESEQGPEGAEGAFVPRSMLPLSLSYDHRVIDGAAAARFTAFLKTLLFDPGNLLL